MYNTRPRRQVLRPDQVRGANRGAILQLLRQHHSLSRAELARRTGLSEGTISRITADLLVRGLVLEEGAENSTGGRPAIRLRLDTERLLSFGVDILTWETVVSVGTMAGRVQERHRMRTPTTPAKTLEIIVEQINDIRARTTGSTFQGIGVSARGLVNSETGVIELSAPGWIGIPAKEILEKQTGLPVFIENDVRAAALAEHHHGSAEIRGSHCMLFVKVSEGIGFGIVLDGQIYRGPRMAAGEFGQMVIADTGGPERNDRPGCLERLASNPATCERYSRLTGNKYRANAGDSAAQVKRICHLATEGDEAAREAIAETSRYLGLGIFNAVWALDAQVVVVDGALVEAWPIVAAGIRDQFPSGEEFHNFRNLILRPSSLAGEATMIGATGLPYINLFSNGESAQLDSGENS